MQHRLKSQCGSIVTAPRVSVYPTQPSAPANRPFAPASPHLSKEGLTPLLYIKPIYRAIFRAVGHSPQRLRRAGCRACGWPGKLTVSKRRSDGCVRGASGQPPKSRLELEGECLLRPPPGRIAPSRPLRSHRISVLAPPAPAPASSNRGRFMPPSHEGDKNRSSDDAIPSPIEASDGQDASFATIHNPPDPTSRKGRRVLSQKIQKSSKSLLTVRRAPDYIRLTNDSGHAAGDKEVRF